MGYAALTGDPGDVDREDAMRSFGDWLGSPVIEVTVRRQHDQCYAIAHLFAVAGVGKTEDEALRDLAGLLEVYLRSYFNEDRPYGDAVRTPSPRGIVGRVLGFVSEVVERVLERRLRLVLPSALYPSH